MIKYLILFYLLVSVILLYSGLLNQKRVITINIVLAKR